MLGRTLAVATVLLAHTAHAEVAWQAPAECGTAAGLTAKIEAQLGRPAGPGELAGGVTIAGDAAGYRATLDVGGAARTLTGAACGEIVDATALIYALAIRDAAELAAPALAVPAAAPLRLAVGALVAGDAGTLPAPAIGAGPALVVGRGRWRAQLALQLWTGRTAHAATAIATDVSLVTGEASLCARLGRADACAVTAAGPMTGQGFDDLGGGEATRWWTAAGAAIGTHRRFAHRVDAEATLAALVALARPRFVFDDGREGYRARPVAVRLGITLSLEFLGGR